MSDNQIATRQLEPNKQLPEASGDNDEDSPDEEIPDYEPGFAGVQKAYDDIQTIFEEVATKYPQWFFSNDDGQGGPGGEVPGAGDHPKTFYLRNFLNDLDKERREPTDGIGELQPNVQIPRRNIVAQVESLKRPVTVAIPGGTLVALPKTLKPGARPKLSYQGPFGIEGSELGGGSEVDGSSSRQFSFPSRIQRLVESDIRHDDFANEFIRASGQEMLTKSVLSVARQKLFLAKNVGPDDANYEAGQEISTEQPRYEEINTKSSSLKLIYNAPIWPHQESLYKMLSRLPALRSLVLDDSKLKWLRDLGSLLPNLKTLSVMRCGLKSLDGCMGLCNLENLFAADNCLTDPSPLSTCTNLQYIDLSDNQIIKLSGFVFLKGCRLLTRMKLMENEVSKRPNFHIEMRRLIPSLRELRPRILEIHGPGVFELYEASEDDGFSVPGSRGSKSNNVTSGTGEDDFSGLGGWPDEERRLRDVYNPGRKGYKKRAMRSIPYTVDEMDALLEELEFSGSGGDLSTVDLPVDKYLWKEESESEIGKRQNLLRVSTVPRPLLPGNQLTSREKGTHTRAKTAVHFPVQ